MLYGRNFVGAIAIGAASLALAPMLASDALAQGAGGPADSSTLAGDRLNQFGEQADKIARRVGMWDLTETVWESPDAAPVTASGLVAERVMMGSLLQEFIRPASDDAHKDVKRTDLLSFNRVEGRWGYVSFDTRAPVGVRRG